MGIFQSIFKARDKPCDLGGGTSFLWGGSTSGLAVKLMDSMTRGAKLIYLYPIIITASIYLLNGSMFTAFVTYGYFVGLLLIWYQNRNGTYTT